MLLVFGVINAAGEIVTVKIVLDAFVIASIAKEPPAGSFSYRLLGRALSLTPAAAGLSVSPGSGVGAEVSARPFGRAGRFGQFTTLSVRSRRCPLRPVFALAGFVHCERPSHEKLIVEAADRLVGLGLVVEFHKRKTPRLAGLAINGQVDVGKRADYRKMLPQGRFSRSVW